jgi:hypothetical protein
VKRYFPLLFLVLLLVAAQAWMLDRAVVARQALPGTEGEPGFLPSPMLKVLAVEFDSVAADFLFLRAIVFRGGKQEKQQPMSQQEWKWMYATLDAATDLDPYFFDPYFFANAFLPWDGGLVEETNALLGKGSRFRTWDWTLPFYRGFNTFYFLKQNEKASEYLMEAARRTDDNSFMATLAARLAYKSNQTENAILFLTQMLQTSTGSNRKTYETRLEAMKGIYAREQAVKAYREKFGKPPLSLEEPFFLELLPKFTSDPYGGLYYLDPDGSIKTTSNLR